MFEVQFELVQPTEESARLIMLWRNDPLTREMSFYSKEIEWDQYYPKIFDSYFNCASLPPLFVLQKGKRVGFVLCRPHLQASATYKKACVISFHVAPEARKQGIGFSILKAISPWVKRQGYCSIWGDVKVENGVSAHLFKKAGFEEANRESVRVGDEGTFAEIIHFRKLLCPEENCKNKQVFIIAEIGSNWKEEGMGNDLSMAMDLMRNAAALGVNAVKFQLFQPESIYAKGAGQSKYLQKDVETVFKEFQLPNESVPILADFARKLGILFLVSVFSEEDFRVVDPYVSMHKIASYEINHPTILDLSKESKKPILLSTGASTEEEIAWALNRLESDGERDITILQCTAKYPAPSTAMHLRALTTLQERFGKKVGLSDHSIDPVLAPILAVALGAKVIEKHITLDKSLKGPDHSFALTPPELGKMVSSIRETEALLGGFSKQVFEEEEELYQFAKRAVQAIADINPHEQLQLGTNIAILRPGSQPKGVHPRYLPLLDGKLALRSIREGEGVQWGDW